MRRGSLIAAVLLFAACATPRPSYSLWIDPEFRSQTTAEEIVDRVLEVQGRFYPEAPPAVVHAVYGGRGEEIRKRDARIGVSGDERVWVVVLTGSFTFPRFGTFHDTEGYILLHPVSGLPFGGGAFAIEPDDLGL